MTHLKELDLRGNKLNSLPETFWNLVNLEALYLGENHFVSIDNINKLENLKQLYIYSNKLTSLPTDIRLLDKLEILDAANNSLNVLPDTLWNLKKLRFLYLHNN